MKKTKFLLLAAALTAGLSACSGGQTQETAAAQTEQESAADDWAARSIEAGKVSSREELTFPIGDQV